MAMGYPTHRQVCQYLITLSLFFFLLVVPVRFILPEFFPVLPLKSRDRNHLVKILLKFRHTFFPPRPVRVPLLQTSDSDQAFNILIPQFHHLSAGPMRIPARVVKLRNLPDPPLIALRRLIPGPICRQHHIGGRVRPRNKPPLIVQNIPRPNHFTVHSAHPTQKLSARQVQYPLTKISASHSGGRSRAASAGPPGRKTPLVPNGTLDHTIRSPPSHASAQTSSVSPH